MVLSIILYSGSPISTSIRNHKLIPIMPAFIPLCIANNNLYPLRSRIWIWVCLQVLHAKPVWNNGIQNLGTGKMAQMK